MDRKAIYNEVEEILEHIVKGVFYINKIEKTAVEALHTVFVLLNVQWEKKLNNMGEKHVHSINILKSISGSIVFIKKG